MDLHFVYFVAVLGLAQSELINLRCDGLKRFVNGHNERRLQLAKGEISGQPAASKMNSMVWDEELAEKAMAWADKEKYGHNPDRTIPSQRFATGENIYKYSTTDDSFQFDPDMALTAWFEEHKDFQYKELEASDFGPDKKMIGHYTQMAWSDSVYLGCGVSKFRENDFNSFYVVCNYGPTGNYLGQTPYKSGTASRSLTCGATECRHPFGDAC